MIEIIDRDTPVRQAIDRLVSNDRELEGKLLLRERRDLEIDGIYDYLQTSRKYSLITIGNTLSDYTNWQHLYADSGYSIWKYPVSNFKHSSDNLLLFDNKLVEYRGEANSETVTNFDKVFDYQNGATPVYNDVTAEAGTIGGTEFEILRNVGDYLYIGASQKFSTISMEFHTLGIGYTPKIEYYQNGATPVWAEIQNYTDETNSFVSDGRIYFTIPSDWIQTDVNGVNLYWIRISTQVTPVTVAKVYSIIPGNSVIGLLNLTDEQILDERWAWCYFNGNIYVTIRNAGNPYYEGDVFITSSSSDTNKQNFFIYNHTYLLFHERADYNPSEMELPLEITNEVIEARGNKSSLDERLSISLDDDGVFTGRMPIWTIATRPQNPTKGMLGFNEEIGHLEYYNGSDWIPLGV